MTATAFIVLAAGIGLRMKSDVPKVLHQAGGQPLIGHVLNALKPLDPAEVCVVVGPEMDAVAGGAVKVVAHAKSVIQAEPHGTGHAVSVANETLAGFSGTIVIVNGDGPLILPETLAKLVAAVSGDVDLAVLGFDAADPYGYGRMVLDGSGKLVAIREELDATHQERKITPCNSGVIAIRAEILWTLLAKVDNDNAKGEYYLTDVIGLGVADGHRIVHTVCDEDETMGVNDRAQLAQVEALLQARYRETAMLGGATLIAPETVFLSHDTQIGQDVVIEPHVVILPGVRIGDGALVRAFCHLEGADIAENCAVGPFARLRPGAKLGAGAKVGNFVEIKNSSLEDGSKVNHLAYIGDARLGAGANVGAGTITCNYDGFEKHFTDIGPNAFIGSNSSLIAPLKIGEGAYVGSGSVVTRDVADDALAVARGKQQDHPGWAKKFKARKGNLSKS